MRRCVSSSPGSNQRKVGGRVQLQQGGTVAAMGVRKVGLKKGEIRALRKARDKLIKFLEEGGMNNCLTLRDRDLIGHDLALTAIKDYSQTLAEKSRIPTDTLAKLYHHWKEI